MATIVAAAGGGNWQTNATWVGGVRPTSADDVQLNATSGNVTIDSGAVCRSLDCTGYTGTLTHTNGLSLVIGDGTAGAGNVALKLVAGMTYTIGGLTSQFTFSSSSATQQTITTAGKTVGSLYQGSGSLQLADGWNGSGYFQVAGGTFDTNNQTVTCYTFDASGSTTRTLTLGSSSITCTNTGQSLTFTVVTNLTMTANTATFTLSGNGAYFLLGNKNFNGMSITLTGGSSRYITVTGTPTIQNFTYTGTASTGCMVYMPTGLTVAGTLTLTGASAVQRILFSGDLGYSGVPSTVTAAAVSITNTDFQDITAAGAASPWNCSTGSVGNALGNTNITFASPVNRYAVASGASNTTAQWAATSGGSAGASVPLCHDNVFYDAASPAGTYTCNMLRFCANLDFTGFTRTFNTSVGPTIFGNLTMASGMSTTWNQSTTFSGRGTHTITMNGKTLAADVQWYQTGTYTLQDNFTSAGSFSLYGGSLNTNGKNVTCGYVSFNGSGSKLDVLDMSNSLFTVTSIQWGGNSQLTLTATGSTLRFTRTGSVTFNTGGKTYNIVTFDASTSTGAITMAGGGIIGTLNVSDAVNARTIKFTSGTTTTVTNFNVNGASGRLITIDSTTASTHTLSKSSGTVSCNYLSIKNSIATGGASWYAGANSTNVSGNTGWTFTGPPSGRSSVLAIIG